MFNNKLYFEFNQIFHPYYFKTSNQQSWEISWIHPYSETFESNIPVKKTLKQFNQITYLFFNSQFVVSLQYLNFFSFALLFSHSFVQVSVQLTRYPLRVLLMNTSSMSILLIYVVCQRFHILAFFFVTICSWNRLVCHLCFTITLHGFIFVGDLWFFGCPLYWFTLDLVLWLFTF